MAKKLLYPLILFVVSLAIQAFQINNAGRTWDEEYKIDNGYRYIMALTKGDLRRKTWGGGYEHPPIGKYIYGLVAPLNMHFNYGQLMAIDYDWAWPRIISATFNALTVVIVYLLCLEFFTVTIANLSAISLTLLPLFLAYGKVISFESITNFFFSLTTFLFLKLLKTNRPKLKQYFILGITAGLLMGVRFNNFFILPFLLGLTILYFVILKKKRKWWKQNKKMLIIPIIAILVFFISWPWLWIEPLANFKASITFHVKRGSPGEYFLGLRQLVPLNYYVVYFFITTPVIYLAFWLVGLIKLVKKASFYQLAIIYWFASPFVLSIFKLKLNGLRYILFFYPALAIMTAFGLVSVYQFFQKFLKPGIIVALGLLILIYHLVSLAAIHPYYLDYFNELVGGPRNVYQKKLFKISWWGEGQREAVNYLNKYALRGSTVGYSLTPKFVAPAYRSDLIVSPYNINKDTDYLIVGTSDFWENKIDEKIIIKKYIHYYQVKADGAVLVTIFKKNTL